MPAPPPLSEPATVRATGICAGRVMGGYQAPPPPPPAPPPDEPPEEPLPPLLQLEPPALRGATASEWFIDEVQAPSRREKSSAPKLAPALAGTYQLGGSKARPSKRLAQRLA